MSCRDDLLGDARAVVVIIGEQAETGVEASAAFAGFNQGDVKIGQPGKLSQRFGDSPSLGEFVKDSLERFAE